MLGNNHGFNTFGVAQGGLDSAGIHNQAFGDGMGQAVRQMINPKVEVLSATQTRRVVQQFPNAPSPILLSNPKQMNPSPVVGIPKAGIWARIKRLF